MIKGQGVARHRPKGSVPALLGTRAHRPARSFRLHSGEATVDGEDLPGDVAGLVAEEEHHRRSHSQAVPCRRRATNASVRPGRPLLADAPLECRSTQVRPRWPGFPAERPRRRRGVRGRPMPTLSTRPSSRSVASPTVASHASGSDTSATITLAVPPSSWMNAALSSAERRFMSAQATGAGAGCARGHVDRHRGRPSESAYRALRRWCSVRTTRRC